MVAVSIALIMSILFSCSDIYIFLFFFFSSRRRHTRYWRDWSSDVCSSDLPAPIGPRRPDVQRPQGLPSDADRRGGDGRTQQGARARRRAQERRGLVRRDRKSVV